MVSVVEEYQNKTIELFGIRKINGECAFCKRKLNQGEYCNCQKASEINRFFKKVTDKIEKLNRIFDLKTTNEVVSDFRPTIPNKFADMEFDCYQTATESQLNALRIAEKYSENGIKNFLTGKNLIFFGNYGTGKTMLMSILANNLARKYFLNCRYVNMVDLMNNVKSTFCQNDKTINDVLDSYKKSDVLFLDDVDKVKPSEFLTETFYSVVNFRTEHELPMIVSANHTPEELDAQIYGEAIVSRLVDVNGSECVHFKHKNFRIEGV